jgi:hypothetical protein
MAIIIKKITKKTLFSITIFSSLLLVFFLKLFLGESHTNLSKMNSLIKSDIGDSIAPIARADSTSGAGSSGSVSGCDGDSSGDGSGDGDGDGDGDGG